MVLTDWVDRYTERDWQTTQEGTVRFALIGLGWWTTDVAIPAIESSTLCETTVLVSSSTAKAEETANRTGVEHALSYEAFHEGVAADAYDAVYIATPNALHLEYAETAAALGKAVLCEKPLEATVERGERLVEAAAENDVQLMTAYRMQTEPAVRRARELIEEGFIGTPVQATGTNSQRILELISDPDQWRLNPDLTGYGVSVMDLGIYPINTVRYLLDRTPTAATAHMRSSSGEFEAVPDEHAAFTLFYEGDIPLLVTTSQNAQPDTRLTISGTDGQIELDPAFHGTASIRLSRGDLRVEIDHASFDELTETREVFDYFADRLTTDGTVDPDGQQGVADLRAIRAIHEASETGTRVTID